MYEAYAKHRPIRFRSVSESIPSTIEKTSRNGTKIGPLVRSFSVEIPTVTVQISRPNFRQISNHTRPSIARSVPEIPTAIIEIPRRRDTKSRPPLIRSVSESAQSSRFRESNIRALKSRPARIRSVSESLPRSHSSESHKKFLPEDVENAMRKVCSLETIPEDHALTLEPDTAAALNGKPRRRGSKISIKKASKKTAEVPPPEADSGWAWVVLAACIYNTIMVLSFGAAFGIQFGPLLGELGMSATTTAWIFNFQGFLWNLCPVVAGPLCRKLGWRRVGLAGAIVSASCFTTLAFANSPIVMFLLYGVVLGLAGGTLHNVTALILPRYFFKHRGLALGLNSTAVGVSQMIMPHLITVLLKEYGYVGSILLRGGLLLNCCVAVSLFRPLKLPSNKPDIVRNLPKSSNLEKNDKNSFKHTNGESHSVDDHTSTKLLVDQHDKVILKKSNTVNENLNFRDVVREVTSNIRQAIFSLKSYRVLINVVMFPNFLIAYINFGMIVPFYMASSGHTAMEAAWALTLSAVSSSIARLFTALLSDRSWFSRNKAFIAGSIIAAISTYGFTNVQDDLKKVYFTMVMWGVGVGTSISLRYVLLIDTVGMNVYVPALGACGFAIALTFVVVGPIFGIIRDAASYSASLGACSVLQLSAALLWLLMPCAKRADLRREDQKERNLCRHNV